ncbi:hypothetical protein V8C42DRAFT_300736 [Trichoderma barbatum]
MHVSQRGCAASSIFGALRSLHKAAFRGKVKQTLRQRERCRALVRWLLIIPCSYIRVRVPVCNPPETTRFRFSAKKKTKGAAPWTRFSRRLSIYPALGSACAQTKADFAQPSTSAFPHASYSPAFHLLQTNQPSPLPLTLPLFCIFMFSLLMPRVQLQESRCIHRQTNSRRASIVASSSRQSLPRFKLLTSTPISLHSNSAMMGQMCWQHVTRGCLALRSSSSHTICRRHVILIPSVFKTVTHTKADACIHVQVK